MSWAVTEQQYFLPVILSTCTAVHEVWDAIVAIFAKFGFGVSHSNLFDYFRAGVRTLKDKKLVEL